MRHNARPGANASDALWRILYVCESDATKVVIFFYLLIPKQKSMGFNYKKQFGVIVICSNEEEQKQVYEQLREMGLKLKVVCV